VARTPFWDPRLKPTLPQFDSTLDREQLAAFTLALRSSFALIQGPPGTGKTFVGVLVTRALLANAHLRARRPIVFVCQTNHALDAILEKVYEAGEENIVRIGGQSKSDVMKSCGLFERVKNEGSTRKPSSYYDAMNDRRIALAGLNSVFKQFGADGEDGIADSSLARLYALLEHYRGIKPNPIAEILKSAPQTKLKRMWERAAAAIMKRAAEIKDTSPPLWASWDESVPQDKENAFDEWQSTVAGFEQLVWIAATAPSVEDPGIPSLLLEWLTSVPRAPRQASRAADVAGWIGASGGGAGGGQSSSASMGSQAIAAAMAEVEEDEDAGAASDRDIEERPDDSEMLRVTEGERLGRNNSKLDGDREAAQRAASIHPPTLDAEFVRELTDSCALASSGAGPWNLSGEHRMELAHKWARLLQEDARASNKVFSEALAEADSRIVDAESALEAEVLRGAAIVGLTTTGAAKYGALLRATRPEVLIVEEAAEVLEAHVLASISADVKHVVLIGDHEQLRPQVATYSLVKDNALDVSLFERLVKAGVEHVTLSTQRRMHPDVSSLVRHIYPKLRDDPRVKEWPMVRGMRDRLFFLSHSVPEDRLRGGGGGGKRPPQRQTRTKPPCWCAWLSTSSSMATIPPSWWCSPCTRGSSCCSKTLPTQTAPMS